MTLWRSGESVALATPKVAGSTPGLALSRNNLGQVVHTRRTFRGPKGLMLNV